MMMVLLVLDDPELLDDVLQAWRSTGVIPLSVIESTGIHRRKKRVPMRYVFDEGVEMEGHFTLYGIALSAGAVEACLKATEAITGDLDLPSTGVFAAWEIQSLYGLPGEDPQP